MAVWPLRGGGRRQRGGDGDDANALALADAADASSSSATALATAGPLGALPPSLTDFLATAPGVAWLADELSDIHVALPTLRAPSVKEFNALILQSYHRLLTTDVGRRLASTAHAQERAAEDVLQVPLFIVEDFVRQRLRSTLARNWGRYAVIVCTRATAATAAVRVLKSGLKWLLRKHAPEGRARRCAEVALDLLVPTELYGALAAVGLVVARLHRELSEIQPPGPLPSSSEGGTESGEAAAAAVAAEVLKRGTAAGRR
jgi:hypothetical protein